MQRTGEMPITPTPRINGRACDVPMEHEASKACTNAHHLDSHHHSLAWLNLHCPQAAAQLRVQLTELALIRKAAMNNQPLDLWLESTPMDDLKICDHDEDAYEKRPLLSESIEHEDHVDEKEPLKTIHITHAPQPTLDDRLVPAGIIGMVIPQHRVERTPQTPTKQPAKTVISSQSWLMRVSMMVLLALVVEGLLAKLLLG